MVQLDWYNLSAASCSVEILGIVLCHSLFLMTNPGLSESPIRKIPKKYRFWMKWKDCSFCQEVSILLSNIFENILISYANPITENLKPLKSWYSVRTDKNVTGVGEYFCFIFYKKSAFTFLPTCVTFFLYLNPCFKI